MEKLMIAKSKGDWYDLPADNIRPLIIDSGSRLLGYCFPTIPRYYKR